MREATASSGGSAGTSTGGASGSGGAGGSSAGAGGVGGATDAGPTGPKVDRSESKLYDFEFKPDDADPQAKTVLGTQLGYLDTSVEPQGLLVVYLHGAGTPSTCGSRDHGKLLAGFGFHVLSPCYESGYGVGNCNSDIGGCRLEAFEGVDHHSFIDVKPPDSIETRVVKGLEYLASNNPQGDWTYFVVGDKPRWSQIIISGISHGASTSGVIAKNRLVHRAVMLSGPLDSNQPWLTESSVTSLDKLWAFSHTADSQHSGHLKTFEALKLVGQTDIHRWCITPVCWQPPADHVGAEQQWAFVDASGRCFSQTGRQLGLRRCVESPVRRGSVTTFVEDCLRGALI